MEGVRGGGSEGWKVRGGGSEGGRESGIKKEGVTVAEMV